MTARIPDRNGWFEIPGNPLAKTGVFDYIGKSINAPDPNKMYKVYRPIEELASPETINSFRLVPLINDHRMLGDATPDAVPAEQKGVHGVIGDQIFFDPDTNTLRGNLKVFSDNLKRTIDAGKVELSLGYLAKYEYAPGIYNGISYDYVQRNIRGNHIALVEAGRMGSDVAVMDENLVVTFDKKDIKHMPKFVDVLKAKLALKVNPKTKKVSTADYVACMDAAEVEAGAPTLEDVSGMLKDVLPMIGDINEALASASGGDDDMEAEMDAAGNPVMDAEGKPVMKKKVAPVVPAATGDADKDAKTMDKATMDAAISAAVTAANAPLLAKIASLESGAMKSIITEVGKRDDLAKRLSEFTGVFDAREMTLAEVAKYGVTKLSIPTADGQEISSVTAWLHGRVAPRATYGMDSREGGKKGSSVSKYLSE